jgi:HEAT repeat protein
LAWAAFRGAEYDLPTDEVRALTQRARTPPPERPSLAEMTVDALLDRFVDATTRLYATRFLDCIGQLSDMAIRNRIVTEEGDILRELKARGALERLLRLFDHANVTVRTEAATACLAIDTAKAIAILEAFPKDGEYLEKCDVNTALERFRRGKGVIWGVV